MGISNVGERQICHNGRPSQRFTSWTKNNPERRFYGCENYNRNGNGGCRVFSWCDPPICDRAKVLIPGLLNKTRKLESKIEELKEILRESHGGGDEIKES
ncbi:hypothetical protein TorRG33x02_194630 [Trema orientale]|uniref:GRF-type domain-containing protein n=1 Tax=Trema orientale TaxID=63057 RepID=A0A2P5EGV3_TREOI|nr:hypothetical protein TorRG33x02_194630 [Trema orientale]